MKKNKILGLCFIIISSLCLISCSKEEEINNEKNTGVINGHEYVDLGLSVKWATCNVGAEKPEATGKYYTWGGLSEWTEVESQKINYYGPAFDVVTNPNILGGQYDVAHVLWGETWRMPTKAEVIELAEKCSITYTTINNVAGFKVVGAKKASIFIPASGYMDTTGAVKKNKENAFIWTGQYNVLQNGQAHYLYFSDKNGCAADFGEIYYGLTIRPVSQ